MDVRYLRGTSMIGAQNPEGDWIPAEEARQHYLSPPGLTVASAELRADRTPAWQVRINPTGWFRFAFHGELGTPLREATWEPVEGRLVLRETRDLFYPEGDPGHRVPYAMVTSVRREFFGDGVAKVELSSPDLDETRTLDGVDPLSTDLPSFGQWAEITRASSPDAADRFGPDAVSAARSFAFDDLGDGDRPAGRRMLDGGRGWVSDLAAQQLFEAAAAVAHGRQVSPGAIVLRRGAAVIIPVAHQGTATPEGTAAFERRLTSLEGDLRGLLAFRTQDPVQFLAADRGWYESEATAAYFDLLKAAGVTSAWYSFLRPTEEFAVVRVTAGELSRGDLSLALHVVPGHWCSDRRRGQSPTDLDLRWGPADLADV
jgi:hypothetical protein